MCVSNFYNILVIIDAGNFSRVADCTAKSIQHVNSGSGEEIKEELLQRAESCVSAFSSTDSIGSSLGSKESRKSSSQLARNDANGHSFVTEGELPKKKNNRSLRPSHSLHRNSFVLRSFRTQIRFTS